MTNKCISEYVINNNNVGRDVGEGELGTDRRADSGHLRRNIEKSCYIIYVNFSS